MHSTPRRTATDSGAEIVPEPATPSHEARRRPQPQGAALVTSTADAADRTTAAPPVEPPARSDSDEGDVADRFGHQFAFLEEDSLQAIMQERDFGPMLLLGLTVRFSRPLVTVLLAFCVCMLGIAHVTAASTTQQSSSPPVSRVTPDQLRVTMLHTLSVSPSNVPDRALPPWLLFITLHGDRVPTSPPIMHNEDGRTVTTSIGNALARFRIMNLRSRDGSVPLQLEQLPSAALFPVSPGQNGAAQPSSGVGTSLMEPRGMALLGDDTLLVASAADDAPGAPKGAVLAVSAQDACAIGDSMHASSVSQTPLSKGAIQRGKSGSGGGGAGAAASVLAVPARILWADGARHPYGVAAAGSTWSARVYVANQGNGRSYVVDPSSGQAILELPRHCAGGSQTGDASSSTTGLRGIAVDDKGSRVFIACKDDNAVYVHDAATGAQLDVIAVQQPIALLWGDTGGDSPQRGIFIGSDSPTHVDKTGEVRVLFWSSDARQIIMQYAVVDGGGHAAGMARLGGALLVLGQDMGELHQFDARSGQFVATLVKGLKRPEGLLAWTGACESA
jgi:hypothetical protein